MNALSRLRASRPCARGAGCSTLPGPCGVHGARSSSSAYTTHRGKAERHNLQMLVTFLALAAGACGLWVFLPGGPTSWQQLAGVVAAGVALLCLDALVDVEVPA